MIQAGSAVIVMAALALAAGLPRSAWAEHEVYYRYTVLGYVTDAAGRPRAAAPVELVRDKTGLPYRGHTGDDGMYVLVARLGDESVGERLTLAVGEARTGLTVRFDAANHRDERGTRVDLDATGWHEHPAWFRSTLARILVAPSP